MEARAAEQGRIHIHHIGIKAKAGVCRNIVVRTDIVTGFVIVDKIHKIAVGKHNTLRLAGGT